MKPLFSCEKVKKLKLAARSNLMKLNKILKNTLLVLTACLVLSACATKKEVATDIKGQMQGDVSVVFSNPLDSLFSTCPVISFKRSSVIFERLSTRLPNSTEVCFNDSCN